MKTEQEQDKDNPITNDRTKDIRNRMLQEIISIFFLPMDNHTGLGECKGHEHTNRVQGNQAFCISLKDEQKSNGTKSQGENAIRIAEPISFFHVHMRHVFVLSHIVGKHRKS